MRILAVSGSLRSSSFNTNLLRAAQNLSPAGVTIDIFEIGSLPPYNDDVRVAGYPPDVAQWRAAIAGADALLFATPEYNYSVPGVLKNAIDWASRPPDMPLAGKPAAIMGASGGLGGTIRAQHHLRQIFVFVDVLALNKPEVVVREAARKFDADGNLTDEDTRQHVAKLVEALVAWTRRLAT
ncbi:MAG: NADPH-dependent FMN reductase [Vicinamibacterales bacterium]